MPRLLYFVPCIKAIIDSQEQTVSIIGILEALSVQAPSGTVPPDAVVPLQWMTIATWLAEPKDEGKRFEQNMQIVTPAGTEAKSGIIQFEITKRTHRNTVTLNAFPVGESGEYTVRLLLRSAGSNEQWRVMSEYPVLVSHERV